LASGDVSWNLKVDGSDINVGQVSAALLLWLL